MKTILTTGGRPNDFSRAFVKEVSEILGYPVVERHKRSVEQMQMDEQAHILVVGTDRVDLYRFGMKQPFFFHPNSAAYRLKRLENGESDPLIEIAQLTAGSSFLDCTLGLASDSIVASYSVGETGKVTGIEADRDIAFITGQGLQKYVAKSEQLAEAMSRIQVVHDVASDFLSTQPEASWDVVYIDPMFSEPIRESSNFTTLRQVGVHEILTEEWFEEAYRVCKQRVVVKDRFDSNVFDQFGLTRNIRLSSKFHYGFIDK